MAVSKFTEHLDTVVYPLPPYTELNVSLEDILLETRRRSTSAFTTASAASSSTARSTFSKPSFSFSAAARREKSMSASSVELPPSSPTCESLSSSSTASTSKTVASKLRSGSHWGPALTKIKRITLVWRT